jgi:hypothetical protein
MGCGLLCCWTFRACHIDLLIGPTDATESAIRRITSLGVHHGQCSYLDNYAAHSAADTAANRVAKAATQCRA